MAAAHLALKAWQAERLQLTYADLLAHPRYRHAALFFLNDLYGARDYSQRDADVARILPKLTALLPAAALSAIADAVELDALSEQLDHELRAALTAANAEAITANAYASAYRGCANRQAREHQIALTHAIGSALDKLTRTAFLEASIKMMRKPAGLAGLAELQEIATAETGSTATMALISTHLRRGEFDKALKAIDILEKKQPGKPLAANLRGRFSRLPRRL